MELHVTILETVVIVVIYALRLQFSLKDSYKTSLDILDQKSLQSLTLKKPTSSFTFNFLLDYLCLNLVYHSKNNF